MTRAMRPVRDLVHSGDKWFPPLKSAGSEEKPARQFSGGALAASSLEALAAAAANRNIHQFRNRTKSLKTLDITFF